MSDQFLKPDLVAALLDPHVQDAHIGDICKLNIGILRWQLAEYRRRWRKDGYQAAVQIAAGAADLETQPAERRLLPYEEEVALANARKQGARLVVDALRGQAP